MEQKKSINLLENIKSIYFLQKLLLLVYKGRSLEIIKYNKKIQQKLNININDYKTYWEEIEINIIPVENMYGEFIHITNEEEKPHYHIYFNNSDEEIKRTDINEHDKVTSIKIVINNEIKSFQKLFYKCLCIKKLFFERFNRTDITNTQGMFLSFSFLEELELTKFKTNSITDMSEMFAGCKLLKKLNLNNFVTNNVTNMSCLFIGCEQLEELNVASFNT